MTDDVDVKFKLSTPHHYLLSLNTNFKDRFKDTAMKMNLFKLSADLECDEATFTYPTTFQASFIFARMIALHTQVMTEKGNNLEAQADLLMRLTKNVYGGGEVIYDDKAKSIILSKYGLFWKYNKDFNLGLEYSKVGDKCAVNGTVYHVASPTVQLGSTFSYDCQYKKVSVSSSINKKLDENTVVGARIDNLGTADLTLKGKLSDNLTATFAAGANISAIFHGKTHDDTYTGVNFKFSL